MTFDKILKEMKIVHDKKAKDYAQDDDPYSNFKFAGELASHFNDPIDKSFVILIGTKLARLIELQDKSPQNESVHDTHLDLCNYVTMWYAYRKDLPKDED